MKPGNWCRRGGRGTELRVLVLRRGLPDDGEASDDGDMGEGVRTGASRESWAAASAISGPSSPFIERKAERRSVDTRVRSRESVVSSCSCAEVCAVCRDCRREL
jgi:hypothetical protein